MAAILSVLIPLKKTILKEIAIIYLYFHRNGFKLQKIYNIYKEYCFVIILLYFETLKAKYCSINN